MFKNRIYGERFTNIGMIFRPADCAWGKRALLLFASFAFGLTAAFAAATPFEKCLQTRFPTFPVRVSQMHLPRKGVSHFGLGRG